MVNIASYRNPLALLLMTLALLLTAITPSAHAADSDDGKTKQAVENAIEKERQQQAQGSDKDDVGETEFSTQDCSELNKRKEAGGKVTQKDLDECENENAE